ncbi:cytochrome P450 [Aquimarina sp. ERC-38]|uniref:cytochrome P450 n=1 Tax=Aquimarina sp. ERC-38 TaxID=2949996 RepID=UPI002246AAA9|nr:cytochrome P450 [Aquimarina sp. ERC-38]UZO81212.1 cytochrome P450 [Aquimarina sp. ERC-38]
MSGRTIPKVSFFEVLQNAQRILKDPLPFHKDNFKKFGNLFEVNLGFGKKIVFTRDAGLAKHTLQLNHKKYHKSPLNTRELTRYIGNGLLTSNGEYWKQQRRLIQPAFYKKKLDQIAIIIQNAVKEEIGKIPKEKKVNLLPYMADLAFNVVAKSLFSYKEIGSNMSRLQHITEAAQKSLVREIRQPYNKWWFFLSGQVRSSKLLSEESRTILREIIEERRASKEEFDDLLDMLLSSTYEDGSKMTTNQLIDEILILFVAGHETTANALTFAFQLLGQHQEIQEKIVEESKGVPEVMDQLMEVFKSAPYTIQCIEETMRLYPPAYFSDRIAIKNDEYEDLKIKKGTTFLFSFYEIHRDERFWENPEAFNPDRMHTDHKKQYANHYFPFGAGPRMCVGSNFAMFEMVATLLEVVKNYKITTEEQVIKINPLITLKPKNAFVTLTSRA